MRRVRPLFALPALVLVFFWKWAFTNLILARGDTLLYFYPYWDYRARALFGGRLPLWDPLLFMGAPFLANPQAGVLYPLNWPLAYFPAPVAVKIAVMLHLFIAAAGVFFLARRALRQSRPASVLAAMLFALGGYVTAQVEHVNQLQGLAYLPWLMVSAQALVSHLAQNNPGWPRSVLAVAVVLALQLLAGHTQTAFISLTAASFYAVVVLLSIRLQSRPTPPDLAQTSSRPNLPPAATPRARLPMLFLSLLAVAALAVLLAAAQVLPALELSGQSLRSGGLPVREALSFSLDPRLLGRALLPGYSRGLFSEYVAYVGVVGLVLAVLGIKRSPSSIGLLALTLLGGAFALGAFNPLYGLLALVPPVNLFRVPARWLAICALGLALLAGFGLDGLRLQRPRGRQWAAFAVPLTLVALAPLAMRLTPAGETGPLGLPAFIDVVGWLLPLGLLAGLWAVPLPSAWQSAGAVALVGLELFVAGQVLPYNHLTAPDAYSSIRPAMTTLLVEACAGDRHAVPAPAVDCDGIPPDDPAPARFLSVSGLRFDPGDLAELHTTLDGRLPADAVSDYVVATKHKEVLSPNLPLAWGVAAVDGYDGGLLPLQHYADFAQLFGGALSSDGRLRDSLTTVPSARLLALANVGYLITDKVGDAWIDGVFYDQQFSMALNAGEASPVAYLPRFMATALGIVADSPSGAVSIEFEDGTRLESAIEAGRLRFQRPARPARIVLHGPLDIHGLSLIDERSGAFQTLTLGPYRLLHSGDVKIYQHLALLPRAFVVPAASVVADSEQARATMADPGFDPAAEVVLAETPGVAVDPRAQSSAASITAYLPELVRIQAQGPGYLILTDAYYPGWVARIDGQPTPIYRADLMFRAVLLPPGAHAVEFGYRPRSVTLGFVVSGLSWALLLVFVLWDRPGKSRRRESPAAAQ